MSFNVFWYFLIPVLGPLRYQIYSKIKQSLSVFFFSALVHEQRATFGKYLLVSLSGFQISSTCFKKYLYFLCTLSSWHFHDALWQHVTLLTSFGTTHCNSLIIFNLFLMSLVQLAHFLLPLEVTCDNLKIGWPDCACCLLLSSILFCEALKTGTGKCHKTCLSAGMGRVELLITTTKSEISHALRNVTCSACGSFCSCTLQRQSLMCMRQMKVFVSMCFNFFQFKAKT